MEINILKEKNVIIIELSGEFTITNIQYYQESVFPLFNESDKDVIVINMANIRFIDSSGIGKLVHSLNIVKNKGKNFLLTNVSDSLLTHFKTVKLDTFFNILSFDEIKRKYIQK
ncbi:MAG TPA: STAS domain-containing protein [Spirochaetota bacterium]|nr:STAS domain-containing protein [Spirochaetota bacterium]HOL57556.1 STAS domain-containing protein [Spirochaetota bacterium]HPP05111.1 STAS domain-containing protein [Spirochaetota bacterium]